MGILNDVDNIPQDDVGDKVKEAISVWVEMMNTRKRIEINPKGSANDRLRFSKLEIKMDNLFRELTKQEQIYCCSKLVESGHMSKQCFFALTLFDGNLALDFPKGKSFSGDDVGKLHELGVTMNHGLNPDEQKKIKEMSKK